MLKEIDRERILQDVWAEADVEDTTVVAVVRYGSTVLRNENPDGTGGYEKALVTWVHDPSHTEMVVIGTLSKTERTYNIQNTKSDTEFRSNALDVCRAAISNLQV